MQIINQTKIWYFKKINETDKYLAKPEKQKENMQLLNLELRTETITDSSEIQKIVKSIFWKHVLQ